MLASIVTVFTGICQDVIFVDGPSIYDVLTGALMFIQKINIALRL